MPKFRFGNLVWWRLKNDEAATSAVEFGMLAPILIFGALLMVDVGMALGERMEMDEEMRNLGAESAPVQTGYFA